MVSPRWHTTPYVTHHTTPHLLAYAQVNTDARIHERLVLSARYRCARVFARDRLMEVWTPLASRPRFDTETEEGVGSMAFQGVVSVVAFPPLRVWLVAKR